MSTTTQPMTSWASMLRSTPVQNSAATTMENRENCITVCVRNRKPGYLVPPLSWIVPFNPERRVTLDIIGSRIWRWCDGTRTVEEVIDRFKDENGLTFHEARAAVTGYLKSLVKRGVLAMVVQEDA